MTLTRDSLAEPRIDWPSWGLGRRGSTWRSLRAIGYRWTLARLTLAALVAGLLACLLFVAAWLFWPTHGLVFPPPSTGHVVSVALPLLAAVSALGFAFLPVLAFFVGLRLVVGTREHCGYFGLSRRTRAWRSSWLDFERAAARAAAHATGKRPPEPSDPRLAEYWDEARVPTFPSSCVVTYDKPQTTVVGVLTANVAQRRGVAVASLVDSYLAYALGKWSSATNGVFGRAGDTLLLIRMNDPRDHLRMQLWCMLRPTDNGRQVSVEVQTGAVWWVGPSHLMDGTQYRGDVAESARSVRRFPLPWNETPRVPLPMLAWLFPPLALWIATGPIRRELLTPRSFVGRFFSLYQPSQADLGEAITIAKLRPINRLNPHASVPMLRDDHTAMLADFHNQALELVHSVGTHLESYLRATTVSA